MFSSDLEAKPQMLSKVCVLGETVRKKSEKYRAITPERFSRDVFLTFSETPHAKHLLLRRFLDGRGPKLVSKVSDSYEAVQQKSKKHHARAPSRAKSDDPLSKNNDFGTLPRIPVIPVIPAKRSQKRAPEPTFHTRRGSGWRELRTNSLKQQKLNIIITKQQRRWYSWTLKHGTAWKSRY